MDPIRKIEAILFAVGKKMSIEKLQILTEIDPDQIKTLLNELRQEYQEKSQTLKVENSDDGMWKLTVQDKYIPIVSNLVQETELERPLMETLAVIAWKYPIIQSEIIKLRGPGAYDHMRTLVERGFIEKTPYQRTYKVKLTKKFFQYFDLPSEEAKEAFLKTIPQEVLEDAESLDKEIDEAEQLQESMDKEAHHKNEINLALREAKSSD